MIGQLQQYWRQHYLQDHWQAYNTNLCPHCLLQSCQERIAHIDSTGMKFSDGNWETGLEPKLSVEYGLMKGMELSLKATMDLDLGHQQGME